MTGRNIGRAGIDEFTIDLVGKKIKVILLHQITYLIHLPARIQVSRGIIGIAYQNGFRAFINQFLKFFHLGERKSFINGGRNGANNSSGRYGKSHIIGIRRFGHDDFVARVQTGQKSKKHGLGTTRRYNDVISIQMNVITAIIAGELFTIGAITLTRTILQNPAVNVPYGVQGHLGGGQIRLTDVQMIHVRTALLRSLCQRSQFAYG